MTSKEETPSVGRRNDSFVEAFAKGLEVIRCFPKSKPFATLAELATATDLPRATTRRMLLTLVELGYVTQVDDRFSLAPRILELGFTYLNSIPLYRSAQDILEALAGTLNELCSLSVLDGHETVYLVRVQGRQFLSRGMGVGTRLPAYATSMGRVLLGALEDEARDRLLAASDIRKLTAKTLTDVSEIEAAIESAKRSGYSLVMEELEAGVNGMAVPVADRRGKVVAAAGLSFNPARFKKKEAVSFYLPKLQEAAAQIALALP